MSITYKDIASANDAIKTTDIKGKDYAEVNQRIKAFRMVFPTGYIITEMKSNENGICIFHAIVGYTDDANADHTLGTGTAYEKEGSSFINRTSYIENCETSAVGRALGMAGFGIGTSIASYEEVKNAIEQQEQELRQRPMRTARKEVDLSTDPATAKEEQLLVMANWNADVQEWAINQARKLMKGLDVRNLRDMSEAVASYLIGTVKKEQAKKKEENHD